MNSPLYARPPITEAVIGINFKSPLSEAELGSAQAKFSKTYPNHQRLENLNLKVALDLAAGKRKTAHTDIDEEIGHRLVTADMTELLILFPTSLIVSQLAPYPGWKSFFGRFDRDWRTWKRLFGFREISRVGVRYINRIDIPLSGPVVEHESYLNIYPRIPDELGPVSAYGVQTVLVLDDIGCKLTLNSAVVPSPLLDYASFVIDQDLAQEEDVPQNDEGIVSLLNVIHTRKNKIFEACITDRARSLFRG